jgi:2-polyprenyl-3-methyl-5-hydroxy-6-metoxy-1,4-benzoquinol methylase
MKVFISLDLDSAGKFASIVRAFPGIWNGRVLDVGCRSRKLKDALPEESSDYLGVDLYPPADLVGNLEAGLPLEEASHDTVVALDVLEHTDNIYGSFAELCRVARKHVLLALPNLYEIAVRKRIILGQCISEKYGLPVHPPMDRHRWIFSFREAEHFTHAMAAKCGFEVIDEGCLVGPRRSTIGFRQMVSVFPNLLSPWYIALLQRKREWVDS